MNHINVKKFGFAVGFTGAICYLSCMIVMWTAGEEGTVKFFNSLIHGLDVTSIIRMNMPISEALLGILQTFLIGWLIGVCVSTIYNMQLKEK